MSFRARVTREDDEDDEDEDARARRRATRTSTRRFVVRMNADIVELTSVIVSEASDTGVVCPWMTRRRRRRPRMTRTTT